MKHSLFISLLIFLVISVQAQTFRFANDGLAWGFVPEWDDWETNAFSIDYHWDKWEGQLDYRIFTDRDSDTDSSSRLDSLQGQSRYRIDLSVRSLAHISLSTGLCVAAYGEFGGFNIQGGWHNNVEVHRQIPHVYDEPYQQISLPLDLEISFPLIIRPSIFSHQLLSLPLMFRGFSGAGLELPSEFLPLKIALGYGYSIGETGNKTIDAVLAMKEGLQLSTELRFWPLSIGKTVYFNNRWGSGFIGILLEKPEAPAPADTVMQLHFLGLTHQSYGLKVMREISRKDDESLLYRGLYYESMAGWMDALYEFPQGGRFSEILLGVEQGISLSFGPFRTDFYVLLNSGFSQEQFYHLASTALSPLYVENLWSYELGGGARLFVPFFFQRKIGLGLEVSRKSFIYSWGNRPDSLGGTVPLNLKLSLAVSS